MAQLHQRRRPMAEINIVPYVDVMLVLLVIFMVTAPLLTQGVVVELPQASAQVIDEADNEPLVATVDIGGNYYLNVNEPADAVLSPESLMLRVAAELQLNPKRPVLVRGDKTVQYQQVVKLMVKLQEAGAPTVGLVTEIPEQPVAR